MKVVAATNNKNKVREFDEILGKLGFSVIPMQDIGIEIDIPETGTTFSENSMIKAVAVSKLCDLPVISDDSGLCIDALDGAPGLYSARFGGEGLSDKDKRILLLKTMENEKDRSAYFISSITLLFPDGEKIQAEGKVFGRITDEEIGDNGFGYDSIFFCDEIGKSFGKATPEEKDSVSHRGRALNALYEKLKNRGIK